LQIFTKTANAPDNFIRMPNAEIHPCQKI
jgi:hypothetical protein